MYRVDTATAVPELPPPALAGPGGFFTAGSSGGQPATIPGPDWFNRIQEELIAVVTAAAIALNKEDNGQLLAALNKLYGTQRRALVYGVQATNPGTYIAWAGEVEDPLVMHVEDGTSLVIPAGVEQVRLKCQMEIQGVVVEAEIRKNGESFVGMPRYRHGDEVIINNIVNLESPIVNVQAGDVFQVYLSQGLLQNNSSGDFAWFALEVIR